MKATIPSIASASTPAATINKKGKMTFDLGWMKCVAKDAIYRNVRIVKLFGSGRIRILAMGSKLSDDVISKII